MGLVLGSRAQPSSEERLARQPISSRSKVLSEERRPDTQLVKQPTADQLAETEANGSG